MYRIQCLNKISKAGLSRFDKNYTIGAETTDPDAILVRSASLHEMKFGKGLAAIARAGAGVNNIPLEKCSEQGIAVFNTPGANANAVKELVIAALFLSSRRIVPAVDWVRTLEGKGEEVGKRIEKGKSAFAGPEISGKTLGVIGLGAIGVLVANAAAALGMNVYGYDPYLSVDAAWGLSHFVEHAHTLDEIFQNCDYITLHVPLLSDTREMINKHSIKKMKDGVRILNFARGELVVPEDVLLGISSAKISSYATDFPDASMLANERVLCVPHLGASTPESENNCAKMAANELIAYLEDGNVRNSVNFPAVSMPRAGCDRVCVFHHNVPNTISLLSGVLASAGVNIENMQSKAKKDFAYTILDVTGGMSGDLSSELEVLPQVIRVRLLR